MYLYNGVWNETQFVLSMYCLTWKVGNVDEMCSLGWFAGQLLYVLGLRLLYFLENSRKKKNIVDLGLIFLRICGTLLDKKK